MVIILSEEDKELMTFLLNNKIVTDDSNIITNERINKLILALEMLKVEDIILNETLYSRLLALTDKECFNIYEAITAYILYKGAKRVRIVDNKIDATILNDVLNKSKASLQRVYNSENIYHIIRREKK